MQESGIGSQESGIGFRGSEFRILREVIGKVLLNTLRNLCHEVQVLLELLSRAHDVNIVFLNIASCEIWTFDFRNCPRWYTLSKASRPAHMYMK